MFKGNHKVFQKDVQCVRKLCDKRVRGRGGDSLTLKFRSSQSPGRAEAWR